ncbi:hypothetical protein DRE_02913 [Drechslerella stenobrocha 248]|uniref:lytic cellulose monooxygenase (C4-dehydrogenating) n=1 Tax=Drechslerella stenobrocha 248 TaxID=1043628 RepID=W7I6C0_9PEZI|nr:hypothetical protein DRE_02913 [Drechslerella stenobrocha 248]
MTYLASCGGDCTDVNPNQLDFFKIAQKGLDGDGSWASKSVGDGGSYVVQIPPSIAAGGYLLRHEFVNLGEASVVNGAQFFPMCASLNVTGSGTLVPRSNTARFPGAYNALDLGVLVNIADLEEPSAYSFPGPDLLFGGEDAGANTTTAASATMSSTSTVSSLTLVQSTTEESSTTELALTESSSIEGLITETSSTTELATEASSSDKLTTEEPLTTALPTETSTTTEPAAELPSASQLTTETSPTSTGLTTELTTGVSPTTESATETSSTTTELGGTEAPSTTSTETAIAGSSTTDLITGASSTTELATDASSEISSPPENTTVVPSAPAITATTTEGSKLSTTQESSSGEFSSPAVTATAAATVGAYGQCGGINYSGPTVCTQGYYCAYDTAWYSQCLPGPDPNTAIVAPSSSSASDVSSTSLTATTSGDVAAAYSQCGGVNYSGPTVCIDGHKPLDISYFLWAHNFVYTYDFFHTYGISYTYHFFHTYGISYTYHFFYTRDFPNIYRFLHTYNFFYTYRFPFVYNLSHAYNFSYFSNYFSYVHHRTSRRLCPMRWDRLLRPNYLRQRVHLYLPGRLLQSMST